MSHQADPQRSTSHTVSAWMTVYGKPVLKFGGAIVSGAGHGLTEISQGVPDSISRLSAPTKLFGNRDISGVIAKKHLFTGMFVIEPVWADGKLYQSLAIVRAHSEGGYLDAQDSGETTREPAPGRRFTLARKVFFKEADWITHAPSLLRQAATELSVEPTIVPHEATSDLIQSPPQKWVVETKPPGRTEATPHKRSGASLAQRAMQNSRRNRRPKAHDEDRFAAFHQAMLEGPVSFPLHTFDDGAEFLTFLADAIEEIPNEGRRLLSAAYGVQKQLSQISVSFSDDCTEAPSSNAQPIDADVWDELGKAFAKQTDSSVTEFIAKRNGWIALKRYMDGGPTDLLDQLVNSELRDDAYAKILYQMWKDGLSDASQRQKNARRLARGLDKFRSADQQDRLEVVAALSNLRKGDDLDANQLFQRHLNLELARFDRDALKPITTLLKAIGNSTPAPLWIDPTRIINRGIGCFSDAFSRICRGVLMRPVELERHQETLQSVLTEIQNWMEPFEQDDKANMIGDTSIAEIKKLFALKFLLEKYLKAAADDDARIDRVSLKSFNEMIDSLKEAIKYDETKTSLAAHTQRETTPELVLEMVKTCEEMTQDEAEQSEIWEIGLDKLFQNTSNTGWRGNFWRALDEHRYRILDSDAFDHPLVAWMQKQLDDGPVKKDVGKPEAATSAESQAIAAEGSPPEHSTTAAAPDAAFVFALTDTAGSHNGGGWQAGNQLPDSPEMQATAASFISAPDKPETQDTSEIESVGSVLTGDTVETQAARKNDLTSSSIYKKRFETAKKASSLHESNRSNSWDENRHSVEKMLEMLLRIYYQSRPDQINDFRNYDKIDEFREEYLTDFLRDRASDYILGKIEPKHRQLEKRLVLETSLQDIRSDPYEDLNKFKKRMQRNELLSVTLLRDSKKKEDEKTYYLDWFSEIIRFYKLKDSKSRAKLAVFCAYLRAAHQKSFRCPNIMEADFLKEEIDILYINNTQLKNSELYSTFSALQEIKTIIKKNSK